MISHERLSAQNYQQTTPAMAGPVQASDRVLDLKEAIQRLDTSTPHHHPHLGLHRRPGEGSPKLCARPGLQAGAPSTVQRRCPAGDRASTQHGGLTSFSGTKIRPDVGPELRGAGRPHLQPGQGPRLTAAQALVPHRRFCGTFNQGCCSCTVPSHSRWHRLARASLESRYDGYLPITRELPHLFGHSRSGTSPDGHQLREVERLIMLPYAKPSATPGQLRAPV